jgi:DNA-binding SARP family transcriptional activator
VDFRILGPVEVYEVGRPLALGGSTARALLVALLLNANRVVPRRRLLDDIWGDDPPETADKMVQIYVSQLRKALGLARNELLLTKPPGYVLELDLEQLDAARFERLVRDAAADRAAGGTEAAARKLREALALWRGPALGELAELPFAQHEAGRLEELRLVATEERVDAELALGAHAALVAELEALVAEQPLRERLRAELMVALYRTGRQTEALELYRRTRRLLLDAVGIEPSRGLQLLERAILQQDESLDLAAPPAAPPEPAAPPREVRKTVSVVFADAVRRGEPLDPEALRRVTAATTDVLVAVLERHGAQVERPATGGVIGFFGVPVVHEDDALRAARAAVEARAAAAALEEGAQTLQVGVSTGAVVAAGTVLQALAISGTPVQEAVRLAQAAEPGEILIGAATEALVGASIVVEHIDPARLGWYGRADGAARLLEVAAEPARAVGPASTMVGRERELAQLVALFDDVVRTGTASLCAVLGPAGIGKSRLSEELEAALGDRATVLSGRCLSYGEGITFWPFVQLVREAAGEASRAALGALLADERDGALVADRIASAIGVVESVGTTEETFWAVRKLFETLARRRPLVVVLDDLHWAQSTLLDLVEHVVSWWSGGAPLLLLGLARPELLDERPTWANGKLHLASIPLPPLSESETDELIETLPGTVSLSAEDRARVTEAVAGNPLFIEQMVAMLSEDGPRPDGELALPPSISALLAARLERLEPAERALLERASVIGKEFWRQALVELTPAEERAAIDAALRRLIDRELLGAGGLSGPQAEEGLRFRHLLIREVVYDSVPKAARAEMHERFADSHELAAAAGELDEIVGYHLEQAHRYRSEVGPPGPAVDELARRAAEQLAGAGRRACVRGDMLAGVSLLARAAALVPEEDAARPELLTELGEALREAGELRRADEVLAEASRRAAAAGDAAAEADAELLRLRLRMDVDVAATPGDLRRAGERAVRLFEELGDDRRLARAWFILAWAPWLEGRVQDAEAALERSIAHARRAGDERAEAQSLHLFVGAGFFGPTPVPAAIQRCRDVIARLPDQQRISASASRALAGLLAMEGDFEGARVLIDRERRILRELGLAASGAIATEVYGLVELLADNPEGAARELRAGYETLEQMGEMSCRPTLAAMLAEALGAQGRDEEALALTEVSEALAAADDVAAHVQWRTARGRALARRGELEEAERLAREALALGRRTPDFLHLAADALMCLAEVLGAGGRRGEAATSAREALALYERKGNRVSAGRAAALVAELGRDS